MHIRYNKLFSLENNNFTKLILFLIFHYHPSREEVQNVKKKSEKYLQKDSEQNEISLDEIIIIYNKTIIFNIAYLSM